MVFVFASETGIYFVFVAKNYKKRDEGKKEKEEKREREERGGKDLNFKYLIYLLLSNILYEHRQNTER